MQSRFTIKIEKDSQGNVVDLLNIPIEAAESFQDLVDALVEMGKQVTTDESNVKLEIKNGSVAACLVYDEETGLDDKIEEVLNDESSDNELTKLLKGIQSRVLANGLEYSIQQKRGQGAQVDLTQRFRGNKFKLRRPRHSWKESVIFESGRLYNAGGKSSSNLHIETTAGSYKIECTRKQAAEVDLYSTVYLAILKREQDVENGKVVYGLLDYYPTEGKMSRYETLYRQGNVSGQGLEKFDRIRDFLVDILSRDDVDDREVLRVMRLYNYSFANRGILRTILVTLKPFQSLDADVSELYSDLRDILKAGRVK